MADWLGDAQIVLIGEATHGTCDFYQTRADLTRRLVERHNFSAVAIEGDWPDAYRVNQYVRGVDSIRNADDALRGFSRFPQWMWRNHVTLEFVEWLHAFNTERTEATSAGFYGLDLYSLNQSIQSVLAYLESVDPAAAKLARESYECFETYDHNTESYAWASRQLGEGMCEDAVVKQLLELRAREEDYRSRGDPCADAQFFSAEQNARLARNAEEYYRTMFQGRTAAWNVRDRHMAETLDELVAYLRQRGQPAKIVVWAHNSHVGDARATEVGEQGELNLGQLARERYGARAKLVGFSTHSGTVTAAADWGEPAERRRVRPGMSESYEAFFHDLGFPRFFLPLRGLGAPSRNLLPKRLLERAIGVIYRPESERWSHYLHAAICDQFDALIYLDVTTALEPLEVTPLWRAGEVPETFPSGI